MGVPPGACTTASEIKAIVGMDKQLFYPRIFSGTRRVTPSIGFCSNKSVVIRLTASVVDARIYG
jgi:hypothetical protein